MTTQTPLAPSLVVTMGMTRMTDPNYPLTGVAESDGLGRDAGSPLTRYYTAAGYPPGRWLGNGLDALAGETLTAGYEVSASDLRDLFEARDPTSGANLGKAPARYRSRADRIAHRIGSLPESLPADAKAMLIAAIEAEERAKPLPKAVAGFDFTFSVPKSVSALWAVADAGLQAKLYDAHQAAVTTVMGLIEAEAVFTRTGTDGVTQERTRGVIAAAFDHWDSREGDPQLHTHVTVPNRVQGPDGKWRTLDSRALYKSVVAYSETFNVLVADEVTRRIGVGWDQRDRGRGRKPARELACVPESIITEFSGRSAAIEPLVDAAVDEYTAKYGKKPGSAVLARIRQHLTLETRKAKHFTTLADATEGWRQRAGRVVGQNPADWARTITNTGTTAAPVLLRTDEIPAIDVASLAVSVVGQVSSSRSTWNRWNLTAEAMRQIADVGWQMVDADQTRQLRDLIVSEADRLSVSISAPELAHVPDYFRDRAGVSKFAAPMLFTSKHVLDAEDRLLRLFNTTSGPAIEPDLAAEIAEAPLPGKSYALSPEDQAPAAINIVTSGRVVDVLVGPAGTGKTTSLAGVLQMHQAKYGKGSVIGLATSTKASGVLAAELGLVTENTAQWLAQQELQPQRQQLVTSLTAARKEAATGHRSTRRLDRALDRAQAQFDRWRLQPGQLLIVDEAGMAGTFVLDKLAQQAERSGAKMLLVGDPHQLSAVETGGAFGLLAASSPNTATLTEVRRFTEADGTRRSWEETAAAGLRIGDQTVLADYSSQGRITSGEGEDMIDLAYTAWKADTAAGHQSLLIAADNKTVEALNDRARADLIQAGTVDDETVIITGSGIRIGRGDRIVTREIDRFQADGTGAGETGRTGRRTAGFVSNGQQWTVAKANEDGSLVVQLLDGDNKPSAARICLTADYVARNVELAYATTCHRAQGMTVHSAYTLVTATMNRALLYVAMTRGARTNQMMVALDPPNGADGHTHTGEALDEDWTETEVLQAVLTNSGTELSAHETIQAEQEKAGTVAQLGAEYESITAIANEQRLETSLDTAVGHQDATTLIIDPNFADLTKAFTAAAAAGLLIDKQLPKLAAQTVPLTAAGLADAVRDWTQLITAGKPATKRRFIAGVIPAAGAHITDPSILRALTERATLIQTRADAVLDRALAARAPWTQQLPPQPAVGTPEYDRWRQTARHVAAYRDRWEVTGPRPLGEVPTAGSGHSRQGDYRRLSQALLPRPATVAGATGSPAPELRIERGRSR